MPALEIGDNPAILEPPAAVGKELATLGTALDAEVPAKCGRRAGGEGEPDFEALTSTGLKPPDELQGLTRTVSDKPGKPHYYDQIAWFTTSTRAKLTLDFEENAGHAGRFEWNKHLLTEMKPQAASWHISDHYPLWVEFGR